MAGCKFSKAEIVDSVYQNSGLNKQEIKHVFNQIFDTIKGTLKGGGLVELRGFGTFEIRVRQARKMARNPRTGELVPAYPHGIVVFKPGKELKREVWPLTESQAPVDVNET
ncbi:MAG: integration host factor subunit beta [Spirochaetaceae bacterium]|jgi:integration host factor subunit beta|nr:integration host factor subunit beta [Spirochaetaceae bacterium]